MITVYAQPDRTRPSLAVWCVSVVDRTNNLVWCKPVTIDTSMLESLPMDILLYIGCKSWLSITHKHLSVWAFAATIICEMFAYAYVVSSGFSVHTTASTTNGMDIIPIMPKTV